MGNYQDLSVKKLTELQDYSEGDKLTMLVQGQSVNQDGTVSESKLLQHVASIDSKLAIPDASKTIKGLVQVGDGIDVNEGVISVPSATIPDASKTVKGQVRIGDGIDVADGVISVPIASDTVAGSVKIGDGITIENGVISAAGNEIPNPAVNTDDYQGTKSAWTENGKRGFGSIGIRSHAEGTTNTASGDSSHAEGQSTKAVGDMSHAEGDSCAASGADSHAEGAICVANGDCSHAEGYSTTASGHYSHTSGSGTYAASISQTVIGAYNAIDIDGYPTTRSTNAFIIGNGHSEDDRSNAHTVTWDGAAWYAGDVTCDAVQGNHENLYSMRAIGAVVASTPSMEHGTSNSVSVAANAHTLVDITFGTAKTEAPIVFTSIQHATAGVSLICTVQSVTNQQASLCVTNLGTTDLSNITIDWLAISGR